MAQAETDANATERKTYPLQELCRRERYNYEHVRRLAEAGRFPVVRLGRRLYVLESAFLEWARGGGMALPGGWRRTPKSPDAAAATEPAPALG